MQKLIFTIFAVLLNHTPLFAADNNIDQNIKRLVAGRLDVFIQTEVAADYYIRINGLSEKIEKAPYKYGEIHPSYFVVSRKSFFMNRIEDFEENLRRFVDEQKYEQIIKKWTQSMPE